MAAPIRKECDEIGLLGFEGMADLRRVLRRRCVSRVWSVYVNNGPDFTGCWFMYATRLVTGHTSALEGARHMLQPSRKGSVFEDLIWM